MLRNRFLFSYHREGERISVTRAGRDRNKNRFRIFLFKRIFFFFYSFFVKSSAGGARTNLEMKEKFEKSEGKGDMESKHSCSSHDKVDR